MLLVAALLSRLWFNTVKDKTEELGTGADKLVANEHVTG